MKDPVRLRDVSSGAEHGVRELLKTARKTRRMTDIERARMVAHGAKIAAMPAGALSSPGFVVIGKVVAGVIVGVVAAKAIPLLMSSGDKRVEERPVLVVEMVRPDISPDAIASQVIPLTSVASVSEQAVVAPGSVIIRPKPGVQQAKPVVAPPVEETPATMGSARQSPEAPQFDSESDGDELTRETRQLGEAARLVATNPTEALERLEAHRLAFTQGKLGIEREVLVMDALMRTGRTHEARARGEALLGRAKGTFYEARVRRMMERMTP